MKIRTIVAIVLAASVLAQPSQAGLKTRATTHAGLKTRATTVAQDFTPAVTVYPKPRKATTVDTYFGTKVADPYRWMEDLNSAEVKQWVDAENAITFKYLDSLPVRSALNKRIAELADQWAFALANMKPRSAPTASRR